MATREDNRRAGLSLSMVNNDQDEMDLANLVQRRATSSISSLYYLYMDGVDFFGFVFKYIFMQ